MYVGRLFFSPTISPACDNQENKINFSFTLQLPDTRAHGQVENSAGCYCPFLCSIVHLSQVLYQKVSQFICT